MTYLKRSWESMKVGASRLLVKRRRSLWVRHKLLHADAPSATLKLAFAHLYQHITDLTLRKMLVDEAHNDGETAWQVVQCECDFPVTSVTLSVMHYTTGSV